MNVKAFRWAIQRFNAHSENHYEEAAFKHPAQFLCDSAGCGSRGPVGDVIHHPQHRIALMANLGISRVGLKVQNRSVRGEGGGRESGRLSYSFCTGDVWQAKKPTRREEAGGNMWRRQPAACESEGSGRNQSESLAVSRGELLIPISGELVRRAKKKDKKNAPLEWKLLQRKWKR